MEKRVEFICNYVKRFQPTSAERWAQDVNTLKPECVFDDEGYIYGMNRISNYIFCCTKRFGWVALPLGYADNPNRLLLDRVIPKDAKQYIQFHNPIRFRYKYNVNNSVILTKVMLEELEGFKTAPRKPQYTRDQVVKELNSALQKQPVA